MSAPELAVIVPARDAARTLPPTLARLARVELPPAVVILVDDGSQDQTAAAGRQAAQDAGLTLPVHYCGGLYKERWVARTGTAREAGRLAEQAAVLADRLAGSLRVSFASDDFAEAQEAKQALAVVGALCGVLRRAAVDAQDRLAGIDAELPGLFAIDER